MNGFGAERQSSIENEPRTLNNNQIEYAREVALYVVNTRSNQEALTIFTQGLEPVERCGLIENIDVEGADENSNSKSNSNSNNNNNNISISQNNNNIRDIVSAPF